MTQTTQPAIRKESFFMRMLQSVLGAQAISMEIESKARGRYGSYRIGITNNPKRREAQHYLAGRNPLEWQHWLVGSRYFAEQIEAAFISKGMNGGTGGATDPALPVYVYAFRCSR